MLHLGHRIHVHALGAQLHLRDLGHLRHFLLGHLNIHDVVNLGSLAGEVRAIHIPVVALDRLGLAIVGLHDGLGLTRVASAGLLRALHEEVLLDQVRIGLLRQLLALSRHFELLSNDSHALVSVKRHIGNLRLEGEVRDRCHIQILHFEQIRYRFHPVLEGKHRVGCHIAELSSQDGAIVGQVRF